MAEHVLILGGGIIGLSCAFEARQRGYRVTLLEPGSLGGQASGAAAGMLAPYAENTEQPDAFFGLCHASLLRYPEWIGRVQEASGMEVEWSRSGSLHIVYHEADLLPLRTRMEWQNQFGAQSELVDSAALKELEPLLSGDVAAALYCPKESHVYAPSLVKALETACRKTGVELLDHAGPISEVTWDKGIQVSVKPGRSAEVRGDRLVVCTGAWTGMYESWFGVPLPVHPIRGQICSYPVPTGMVRHMVFSSQAYWVAKGNQTLVCGASEDVAGFDTSVTDRGIGRLTRMGPRVFPFLGDKETVHRWAGLRPATRDGWPLIGELPHLPRVILAAGHYRNGILLSPITAFLVSDLLDGKQPEISLQPFAPHRFAAGAVRGAL
ncbi:glycine oxidase ThiO [Paenibacillus abyssi]|uniref:glycine oxidase n=1 Tax=Paenibacillus abyssi TaxID=1340531 RepID=A0A917CVC5_9BACL|nr:glycine oxidase ThiO [Paenibacillus abyssi]GGF98859.1 glycine oxidase ThiO [Paenibacillus abyssi]